MSPRWQAARRELLYLSLAGTEICFLVPLILGLSQFAARFRPERVALAYFVIILIAFYLARLLNLLDLQERVQRDISVVILILWVMTVLRFTLYRHVPLLSLAWLGELVDHLGDRQLWPKDLVIIITTLVFWWRGMELAQRPLDVQSVGYSFRAGVLIVAFAVGIASQMVDWSPIPFIFAFFFLSLVSVALSRAEEVGTWRIGLPFPFSLGWLLSIAGAAAVVILVSIGLISIVTGESLANTLSQLGPVWDLLRLALLFILSLMFYLLYPLFERLMARIAAMLDGTEFDMLQEFQPPEELLIGPGELIDGPSRFAQYEPLLVALFVLTLILLAGLTFGRMWRARRQLGQAETDSVLGEGAGQGLAGRLRDGLQNLAGRIGLLSRWRATVSIRRIYANMVAAAARRGFPRERSDTPYEYLPTLLEAWPGMAAQTELITEAYIKTHYGELPETEDELQNIRAAWAMLREHE